MIFIANIVAKPYATLIALVNFFQRIKTSLVNKLFLRLYKKIPNASKPYATLFALVKLFTKIQDQFCIQVGYETFQPGTSATAIGHFVNKKLMCDVIKSGGYIFHYFLGQEEWSLIQCKSSRINKVKKDRIL